MTVLAVVSLLSLITIPMILKPVVCASRTLLNKRDSIEASTAWIAVSANAIRGGLLTGFTFCGVNLLATIIVFAGSGHTLVIAATYVWLVLIAGLLLAVRLLDRRTAKLLAQKATKMTEVYDL